MKLLVGILLLLDLNTASAQSYDYMRRLHTEYLDSAGFRSGSSTTTYDPASGRTTTTYQDKDGFDAGSSTTQFDLSRNRATTNFFDQQGFQSGSSSSTYYWPSNRAVTNYTNQDGSQAGSSLTTFNPAMSRATTTFDRQDYSEPLQTQIPANNLRSNFQEQPELGRNNSIQFSHGRDVRNDLVRQGFEAGIKRAQALREQQRAAEAENERQSDYYEQANSQSWKTSTTLEPPSKPQTWSEISSKYNRLTSLQTSVAEDSCWLTRTGYLDGQKVVARSFWTEEAKFRLGHLTESRSALDSLVNFLRK